MEPQAPERLPHDSDPERRPRPEAMALSWKELLAPTQAAMEELIHWLTGALGESRTRRTGASDASPPTVHEQLATSVLIAGDRGFGKTTLLLTLAEALHQPARFLLSQAAADAELSSSGRISAAESHPLYRPLHLLGEHLVMLTPLDMEPLPAEANLLATLLVRVRDALNVAPSSKGRERLASPVLLEEGADEPWSQIDQLVREATFMWEDIPVQGQDPRQRAEYQLRSAELFASFQGRFYKAIDAVARHLARRRFGYDSDSAHEGVMLVLPIDNVDRSIQHLHLILKLTRMVASRRLWFLLAAGRQEFQLFLERTFQKELADSGRLLQSANRNDQTLAIARRQAAAAMRRVLPQTHRIEIRSLTAREVWDFHAPASLLGERQGSKPLGALLAEIPLPGRERPTGPGEPIPPRRSFAALFDLREWLHPGSTLQVAPAEPLFTDAARLALTMSARTALDLWQAVRKGCSRSRQREQVPTSGREEDGNQGPAACSRLTLGGDEPAITVSHQMLLMAIDESDLPSWASEQLLHRLIRCDVRKRTVLDLTGMPIRRLKRTALADALDVPPLEGHGARAPGARVLRSELHLRHFQDAILQLHDLENPARSVPLPSNVAGWFMLLHDLLIRTEEQRVLNLQVMPLDVAPELVVSQHEARLEKDFLFELNLWWIPPEWETFIDFAIFTHQWKECFIEPRLAVLQQAWVHERGEETRNSCLRLILAAWVDNVCSVAGRQRGGWQLPLTSTSSATSLEEYTGAVESYEQDVARHVLTLFQECRDARLHHDRARIAWRWLRYSLPLMLQPEFLPASVTRPLWELLSPELAWDTALLQRRRFEMVRAVLQRSDAYQRQEALFNRATGPGAQQARDFLLDCCATWFRSVASHFDGPPGAPGGAPEEAPARKRAAPTRVPARGAKTVRRSVSAKESRRSTDTPGKSRPGSRKRRR
ncbi:hypothetical protein [Pyxidicoccus trucidator]|uniref:hypothetical protein n=1 Tax=Pyxidicoccus trucidator TaxID=2709662 RepID=UPI0013DC7C9C|nr:hypothetical protein [Pyxidicoccus trucidator]